MLTKKQKLQLILLTGNEKYGQMVADAIEIWSREDIFPCRGSFGVTSIDNIMELCDTQCCLIGAFSVGKTVEGDLNDFIRHLQNSNIEIYSLIAGFDALIAGFDGKPFYSFHQKEAYDFGAKVAKIVFG